MTIDRKKLRWIEAVLAVILIGCIFLRALHQQAGLYVGLVSTFMLCILYNAFFKDMFLDNRTENPISGSSSLSARYYARLAGFICSFLAIFNLRFMLAGPLYVVPFAVVLIILLGVFFLTGLFKKKNPVMLHALLDGMRSMIIMAIPYAFWVQFVLRA